MFRFIYNKNMAKNITLCIQYAEVLPDRVIALDKSDIKYLFNVMRCKKGDKLLISDGKGKIFSGRILNKNSIEIIKEEVLETEDRFSIILCQGLLKGDKMDFVIQKATELGVKEIIPFISERSIPKNSRKIERWKKIAKEASEQSKRKFVPHIKEVRKFNNLVEEAKSGILFWENSDKPLIKVFNYLNLDSPLFLFVGPEGGFSSEEVCFAEKFGIKSLSLGKRILRAETAAISSIAILSFLLENYDIIKIKNDIKL